VEELATFTRPLVRKPLKLELNTFKVREETLEKKYSLNAPAPLIAETPSLLSWTSLEREVGTGVVSSKTPHLFL
jgi:hypothetical protein